MPTQSVLIFCSRAVRRSFGAGYNFNAYHLEACLLTSNLVPGVFLFTVLGSMLAHSLKDL